MKRIPFVLSLVVGMLMVGCSTPSRHVGELRLGMTPDEVVDTMGKPFAIRGAKLYEGEEWQEIWEYIPPVFSVAGFSDRYDKQYWLTFENGRLVQWGEPADFSGETSVQFRDGDSQTPLIEYSPAKEE